MVLMSMFTISFLLFTIIYQCFSKPCNIQLKQYVIVSYDHESLWKELLQACAAFCSVHNTMEFVGKLANHSIVLQLYIFRTHLVTFPVHLQVYYSWQYVAAVVSTVQKYCCQLPYSPKAFGSLNPVDPSVSWSNYHVGHSYYIYYNQVHPWRYSHYYNTYYRLLM